MPAGPFISEPAQRGSAIEAALRGNDAFAAATEPVELGSRPSKRLAVVACMDARMDLHRILGLSEGEAHVIRNAGGVVTDDVIRSLTISQRLLGTQEVMVVMHTGCGMHGLADAEFRDRVQAEAGLRPPWAAEGFPDLDQAVREGLGRLRTSPFVPHTGGARGFVYDVATRKLREVV